MKNIFDKIKGKAVYICVACVAVVALTVLLINAFQPESASHQSDAAAVITTATDAEGNTITHLYKKYSETFIADTDIPTDTPESAEVYYAEYVDFDEELLCSLFMDGVETERIEDDGGIYYYDWADENKKECNAALIIYNQMNWAYYRNTAVGDYYKLATENFHTRQSIKGAVSQLPLYETVYKTEDLGFMSMDEAVAYVKENLFDKLGYVVSDEVEIYAIDHKTMQSYQDSELQAMREQDPPPEGFEKFIAENYKIKETFTEEDDFYILCFTVEQSGIMLSGRNYFTMSTGRQMQGANIRVHLNRDGVFYFDASGIMQMGTTESESQKLLTAEEAMDVAYDMYTEIITTDSVVIDKIELEYASVPYNDNYDEIMLVPSWIMTLNYTASNGPEWIETLSINAVTGEEIK